MTTEKQQTDYYLSTEGYTFRYRKDKYDPFTTHVEMFKEGVIVHKQMSESKNYGVYMNHHDVVNTLEALIMLNQLDPTGLKQII